MIEIWKARYLKALELLEEWEQEATERAKKELKRGLPRDVECLFNPSETSLLGRTRKFLNKPPEKT